MRLIDEKIGAEKARLQGVLHTPSLEMPALLVKPAVLVIPGGGFRYCSERETDPLCAAFLRYGCHAFSVDYSTDAKGEDTSAVAARALNEVCEAHARIAAQAVDWGVDVHQMIVIGLGTGAQLAVQLAKTVACKPAALVLGYPSFPQGMPEISDDMPPAFAFASLCDQINGTQGAYDVARKWADASLPCELHVFASGYANIALADASLSGLQDAPDAAKWLELCAAFIRRVCRGETLMAKQTKTHFNINSTISELMQDSRSAAILMKHLGFMKPMMKANAAMAGLSPRQMATYSRGAIPADVIEALTKDLAELNTASEVASRALQTAIRPGKVWRDTQGQRIQAHGGAMWYENGVYYWYGENKEHTNGRNGLWTSGIRAYSSRDLYNWQDEGVIIPPSTDPTSNLYPTKRVDRPHIVKSDSTGRYVCWIKLSGSEACFTVCSADQFLGPWRVEKENYRPNELKVGDFDIVRDEESGVHYLFMEADHEAVVTMALTDDCMSAGEVITRSYEGLHPPFTREGVAVFEHEGRKYMLTSGMTGYIPNPSDSAVAACWQAPFVSLGDPHENDESHASFNSQISKVFSVAGKKGLWIAMADRWVPEYKMDARRVDLFTRCVANKHDPEKYPAKPEDREEVLRSPMLNSANTSLADYVWLPVTIEHGKPVIRWYDEWRIEDFD